MMKTVSGSMSTMRRLFKFLIYILYNFLLKARFRTSNVQLVGWLHVIVYSSLHEYTKVCGYLPNLLPSTAFGHASGPGLELIIMS
jgi:hypothetical protein